MVCWLDAAVAALHPTLKRCNFSHCKLQATLTRNIIENPQQQWNERDLLRQLLVVAAGKHILSKRTPSLFTLWQLGSPLTHDDRVCHCCCCNYGWSYQRDSFSLSVVETEAKEMGSQSTRCCVSWWNDESCSVPRRFRYVDATEQIALGFSTLPVRQNKGMFHQWGVSGGKQTPLSRSTLQNVSFPCPELAFVFLLMSIKIQSNRWEPP